MSYSSTSRCSSMSLGKYVRCAVPGASGRKALKDKPRKGKKKDQSGIGGGVSMELSSSSSSSFLPKDTVVQVVLASGMVELYTGVVMACKVMEKHPGLCVAHPDVFKKPHSAIVGPLEPLFPGQKFYLLPQSTMDKLQRKIPEGTIGAAGTEDDDSGSVEATSTEEEEEEPETSDRGASAREYYVAKERWSKRHFKRLVARGLAVEGTMEAPEKKQKKQEQKQKQKKAKSKAKQGRQREATAVPAGYRTPRRTWEPSLPSVQEEASSSQSPSPSETRTDQL